MTSAAELKASEIQLREWAKGWAERTGLRRLSPDAPWSRDALLRIHAARRRAGHRANTRGKGRGPRLPGPNDRDWLYVHTRECEGGNPRHT